MRRGGCFLFLLVLLLSIVVAMMMMMMTVSVEGKKPKASTKASTRATRKMATRRTQQQKQGKKVVRKSLLVNRRVATTSTAPPVMNLNKVNKSSMKSRSVKLKVVKKKLVKRKKLDKKVDLGVLGDLSKSTLLTANQSLRFIDELLKDVKTKPLKLLYKASNHGFNVKMFHSKCDNQGPTVTIIKAKSGAVFGGYTSLSWRSEMLDFYPDSKAFLFSLIGPKKGEERFKKLNQDGPHADFENYAVYHRAVDHPTFGGGHDIFIAKGNKKSFTNPFTYSNLGKDYLTGSVREFTTVDYEVYSL